VRAAADIALVLALLAAFASVAFVTGANRPDGEPVDAREGLDGQDAG